MSEPECICAKDCPATKHDYPPIEVDEELREAYAKAETLRAELVDARSERDAYRHSMQAHVASAERMRPIVDAAIEYMITVERYDTTDVHRTGKGSRARIRQAVAEYLKSSEETQSE